MTRPAIATFTAILLLALTAGLVAGWAAHATIYDPTPIVHATTTTSSSTTTTIPASQCHDRLGNPYTAQQCPPPQ